MALDPSTEFTGKITAPDANYPYGSARDITVPGDGTGTPWLASLVNDIFGFQQALLNAASIVPSGSPDTILASDYLDAVDIIKAQLANNQQLVGRNVADTLNRALIGLNASDVIELGNAVNDIEVLSTSFTLSGSGSFLDVNGILRATGVNTPAAGAGVEIQYTGTEGRVQSFDRGGAVWKDLSVRGLTLSLDTNGTPALTIDALRNVTMPNGYLTVIGPSSVGGHSAPAATTIATFRNRGVGGCYLSLITDTTELAGINFGHNGDENDGIIQYDNLLNQFEFFTFAGLKAILKQGLQIGAPTGGDKGVGSVNAEEYYQEGERINGWFKHATVHTAIVAGTSLSWTGIPSSATHIKIVFGDHSANASQDLVLKTGDAGGIESTGYNGRVHDGSTGVDWNTFADMAKGVTAGDVVHGTIELTHKSGFGWGIHGNCMEEGGSMHMAIGSKATSAALDRVELSMSAGAAFDGGGDYALYYQ